MIAVVLSWFCIFPALGADGPAAADEVFDRVVAPVLSAHCLSCHGGAEPQGALDLGGRAAAMRGGDSGQVIVPGDLDASYLWELVESDAMPPEHPLPADAKRVLRDWISQGASWGSDPIDPFQYSSSHRAGYDWWSLQPLSRPSVPQVEDASWCVNPVDRFILARLQSHQLRPSPRASGRSLVRRLYVDLLGLPAPAEVIDRFVADPSQQAWEQLVDELLSSPHYGERWARHWMDVAGFGESDGYEYNRPREDAWHYRDWLIRSLNEDMPYDAFVRMQLAGDILQPNTREGAAAVGFLVAGPHNPIVGVNPAMQLAARQDALEGIAATVGQTFLGMTIHCARCHDHKFDPITSREYYRFIAALDGVQHGTRKLSFLFDPSTEQQLLTSQRDGSELQLVQQIIARGGSASKTANQVRTKKPLAANEAGRIYRVSLQLAPSVWASQPQATTARDGVTISILKADGLPRTIHSASPGEWQPARAAASSRPVTFEYVGDGQGNVQLDLRPFPLNSERFGGAVDDLTVVDVASGRILFQDSFDDLQQHHPPGKQADTGRHVYFGATSDRWQHSGANAMHAVELTEGDLALQLFSGNGGAAALEAVTPEEQRLRAEIVSLEQELDALVTPAIYTVIPGSPGAMPIYQRGDVTRPGEEVTPGGVAAIKSVPATFDLDKAAPDAQRRFQLAHWVTHPENPLFQRVAVNRIWHYHFGEGLVPSPSDFGFNGGQPSHPGLLDWLSILFRDEGYSIKGLHRLIVTSATYQQASRARPNSERIDKTNRYLWRQNPRRVEGEVLRDSVLEIAGQLQKTFFGPSYHDVEIVQVPPAFYYSPLDPIGEKFNRRTIYRLNVRGQRSALLDTFDCPDPSTSTPKRMVTTTPSQALSQWNDRFITRMSEHLANRVQAESNDDPAQQVTRAWQLVLGRSPSAEESEKAMRIAQEHGLPLLCRVLFSSNAFILID